MERFDPVDSSLSERVLDHAWREHIDMSLGNHAGQVPVISGLRVLLYADFAEARDWDDLAERLWMRGYELAGVAPLLRLVRRGGEHVCQIGALGEAFAQEVARLCGAELLRPFAGYPVETMTGDTNMADKYSEGTKVEWDWGNGTAQGKVEQVYTQKRTLKIKGEEVTRDADDDNPAYKIEQDDGDIVLKSHSEVRKAS